MRRFLLVVIAALAFFSVSVAFAKGGFSGGGGSRGGFSSSRSAPSYSAPRSSVTTTSPGVRSSTVTTTTTSRSYGGGGYHYGPGVAYGGMGMGYGYSNGMLTGLLIGNMLHPQNTVMYAGPGSYANNALMYPDGRVVSSSGQLVGNYVNGTFTAVDNGPIVAQSVPQQQAQPVVIRDHTNEWIAAFMVAGILLLILFIVVI